jgi:hypothetical protein
MRGGRVADGVEVVGVAALPVGRSGDEGSGRGACER